MNTKLRKIFLSRNGSYEMVSGNLIETKFTGLFKNKRDRHKSLTKTSKSSSIVASNDPN